MEKQEFPYCPISRQLCQQGKVFADSQSQKDLTFCAFWHLAEHRCVFRMVEYDLFNIARSMDEIRSR
ncbi:MAG: hypothetical protein KJ970_00910 [Candidatus Eisenbacteria bacterium]|uniref:Uncharacterized protein n=1 Tax=Eiseniibacteriota bacterium TaxID=2212470 RepID=A0A948RT04_UNCEI|nr:hypothetical protein [Candidatus Eisenbacteria bacterium]MBU1947725.1 hypothetical protein [Candidatus Eisenbacteria bacterium]MBU2689461.1 hypothetical protein [Candidatus Eisenbacteria bacterium]